MKTQTITTSKIKALFFDFDGTISDAKKIAEESLVETLNKIGYHSKTIQKQAKEMLGTKMPEIFKKLNIKLGIIKRARKFFYKQFTTKARGGGIKLCCSIKPLEDLKKQKILLIVISNSETSFIKTSAKILKVKKLFKKIYGAEKFSTKDKIIKKIQKKHKLKPYEIAYIGDRFSDVKYARKAGVLAIAINNKCSWSSLAQVKKEKPDFIIKDFKQLKKIIEKINKD